MSMNTWLLIGGIVLAAGAGFFLFMTPEGNRFVHGIRAKLGGYEDPFKYYDKDPEAFDITSQHYKDIMARTEARRAKERLKSINKKYLSVDDYYDE